MRGLAMKSPSCPPSRAVEMGLTVEIADAPFAPGAFLGPFTRAHPGLGALCTFTGEVRGGGADGTGVEALELQHYPPLTRAGMLELGRDALARFDLVGLLMVHRVGVMEPGDPIVLVAACATHRRPAFDAVDFCMDHLKSRSWFWKREKRGGAWHWIEPTVADQRALERWKAAPS